MTDAFCVASARPPHDLVLTVPEANGGNQVSWSSFCWTRDAPASSCAGGFRAVGPVQFRSAPARPAASFSSSASTKYWRTPRGHQCLPLPASAITSCKPEWEMSRQVWLLTNQKRTKYNYLIRGGERWIRTRGISRRIA